MTNSLTSHNVVDRMTADLAQRRRKTIHCRAAYLALAQAILSDPMAELPMRPALQRRPTPIRQTERAA